MIGRGSAYPRSQSSIDRENRSNHLASMPKDTRRFRYQKRVRITDKAVLVQDANGQYWLPKSQSWHGDYQKGDERFCFVDLPKWLAEKSGMRDEITGLDLDTYATTLW